jgi:hypothetical protein
MSAIVVNLTGETMLAYSLSLLLVGIGWNFMFVGGSTLLSLSYRDHERKKRRVWPKPAALFSPRSPHQGRV